MLYDFFEILNLNVIDVDTLAACIAYLGQVLVRQKVQFSRFKAILTFTFVEKVGLEFSTGVFFCGRHDVYCTKKNVGLWWVECL